MDFREYMVKRKKSKMEVFYTVLLYVAALVIAFFSLALGLVFIPVINSIWLLLIVGLFYLVYRLSRKFNREYEYIITKDIVDVDVIYNASTRKRLISFSVHEVEEIAPAKDQEKLDKRNFTKVINATTNSKYAEIYYAIVEKEGRVLVCFEPPYSMLEMMKKLEPRKVTINE